MKCTGMAGPIGRAMEEQNVSWINGATASRAHIPICIAPQGLGQSVLRRKQQSSISGDPGSGWKSHKSK
jgi:uncharacterized protein YaaW (UPF0174 family)